MFVVSRQWFAPLACEFDRKSKIPPLTRPPKTGDTGACTQTDRSKNIFVLELPI